MRLSTQMCSTRGVCDAAAGDEPVKYPSEFTVFVYDVWSFIFATFLSRLCFNNNLNISLNTAISNSNSSSSSSLSFYLSFRAYSYDFLITACICSANGG